MKLFTYTLLILATVSCGVSPLFPTATPELRREPNFTSLSGDFSVWMPEVLELNDETQSLVCIGKERDVHIFFARSNELYSLVQYCELAEEEMRQLSISDILDQARDEALSETYSRLQSKSDIALSGYSGKQILADSALRTSGMEKPDGTYLLGFPPIVMNYLPFRARLAAAVVYL